MLRRTSGNTFLNPNSKSHPAEPCESWRIASRICASGQRTARPMRTGAGQRQVGRRSKNMIERFGWLATHPRKAIRLVDFDRAGITVRAWRIEMQLLVAVVNVHGAAVRLSTALCEEAAW